MLSQKIKSAIRDVPDFPKPGIVFKDITPLLQDAQLGQEIVESMASSFKGQQIDAVAGVESRGFLYGMMLAKELNVPFVPIRKKGKLPYKTISCEYDLEYGSAVIEMHEDAIESGWNVLIHDDLLATGGTAAASAELIKKLNGTVAGFAFVVELGFLNGKEILKNHTDKVVSLISY